ncbi:MULTISPECIES: alpha/beta hydrolase [unclassified Rhodococcus (in: high G+C Gram-positive bacteria)]|uniref:alpha/beta hydrolase n=1 Tax=unclassified Rhodococcus (in: high G+C Gram-positive bacteria) TaxID=192944 RepID=UPI0020CF99F3|nr:MULTISPECIES: alpha/beta hydrolase [unclassified Rhodococcus (in: high G+C Gram-positive bacteria)]
MPQTIPTAIRRKDEQRRWPKPVMAAAAAASVLLLAGCSGAPPSDDDSANGVGLERFMEQELAFGACDASVVDSQPPVPQVVEAAENAECAMLTVPMDYEDLDGETVEIAVSRISATGDNPIGSVLLNPGGPGAAGTTLAPLVNALWTGGPIPERFDIVGFDPRGVGLSNPAIDCYSDEERDADAPLSALGTWTEESARAIVDKCADGSGNEEVLAHLGTRDVARDMDVLRSALGDDKLTYAGVSYGTRLGSVYAEMFPENVRALVLDGAVDPLMDTADRRIQLSEGVQASFQRFADFCMTQAACPLGTDPAQATAAAQELLQPLEEEPLVAADGREVGFLSAGEGIVSGLYSEASWPAIIAGLTELEAGRPDALLAIRDGYYGRSDSGEYTNSFEALFAINCLDEQRFTEEEMTQLGHDLNEAVPFLDPGSTPPAQDGCEFWPVEPTLGYPYATDIDGLPEVLVISATGDPVTPHEGGISLADTLGARLLTVDGNQHGTIISANACVDGAIADYLIDLELPDEGARCTI